MERRVVEIFPRRGKQPVFGFHKAVELGADVGVGGDAAGDDDAAQLCSRVGRQEGDALGEFGEEVGGECGLDEVCECAPVGFVPCGLALAAVVDGSLEGG